MKRRNLIVGSIGALAVTAVATGVSWATIGGGGVINACYQKNSGALRVIDTASDSCRSSEVALDWNQTGQQGASGPSGPAGPPGPSSAQSISPGFVGLVGKTTVGTMSVDAGAYAIQAKTVVADDASESVYVFCFLDVNNPADEDLSATMVGTGSARQTVALQLTHTFTSGGTITLSCQPTNPPGTTNVGVELTKITAVKVDSETH
jgi:hypothetical protein